MKGPELAAALETLVHWARRQETIEGPLELSPLPGLRVLVGTVPVPGRGPRGGFSNAEKCRRSRLRAQGIDPDDPTATPVRAESRHRSDTETDTDPTPVSTPKPTPIDTGRNGHASARGEISSNSPESQSSSNSFGTTTTPGSGKRDTDPTPVATPIETARRHRPRNLEEALGLSLLDRASTLWQLSEAKDDFGAQAMCPNEWPELQELGAAYCKATGQEHTKVGPWPNPNTKRLVEYLAAGHAPSAIRQAFSLLPSSSWFSDTSKRRLGLAGISVRVLEGVMTEHTDRALSRRESLERLRRAEDKLGPSPLADVLSVAMGGAKP